VNAGFKEKFTAFVNEDLNVPRALALVWEMLKSDLSDADKKATVAEFDRVFGLGSPAGNRVHWKFLPKYKTSPSNAWPPAQRKTGQKPTVCALNYTHSVSRSKTKQAV
jgi:hypothetical protein